MELLVLWRRTIHALLRCGEDGNSLYSRYARKVPTDHRRTAQNDGDRARWRMATACTCWSVKVILRIFRMISQRVCDENLRERKNHATWKSGSSSCGLQSIGCCCYYIVCCYLIFNLLFKPNREPNLYSGLTSIWSWPLFKAAACDQYIVTTLHHGNSVIFFTVSRSQWQHFSNDWVPDSRLHCIILYMFTSDVALFL